MIAHRKQGKLAALASLVGAGVLISVFFTTATGCNSSRRPDVNLAHASGIVDSAQAAYLAEVLRILVETPPPLDPVEARQMRRQLQEALDAYFQTTGTPDRERVSNGPSDRQQLTTGFPGPVLDLVQVDENHLLALEKDSVAVLALTKDGWGRRAMPLAGLRRRDSRPVWPAARLGVADLDGDGVPEVFARHSDFEGLFVWRYVAHASRLVAAHRLRLKSPNRLEAWDCGDYVAGRPYFALKGGPVRFAYDRIALGKRSVALDIEGGLWLVDSAGNVEHHLEGRFGTKLIPISERRFAVLHPHLGSLLLFDIDISTLRPVARGERAGDGRVTAASSDTDGLWLATGTLPWNRGLQLYRIQKVPFMNFSLPPFPQQIPELPTFGGRLEICLMDSLSGEWPDRLGGFQPTQVSKTKLIAAADPHDARGRPFLDSVIVRAVPRSSALDLLHERPRSLVVVEDRNVIAAVRESGQRRLYPLERRLYLALVGAPLDQPQVRTAVLREIDANELSELVVTSASAPLTDLFGWELPAFSRSPNASMHVPGFIPVSYRPGDRTAREIAERLTARLNASHIAAVLAQSRSQSAGSPSDRPLGVMIDYLPGDPWAARGHMRDCLGRYPGDFDREIELLDGASGDPQTDLELVLRVAQSLAGDSRLRPILAVRPYLAVPREFWPGERRVAGHWPDLTTAYWTLPDLAIPNSP